MSNQYTRLAEHPSLVHPGYPSCGACDREVDYEDGGWVCPSCGTCWPGDRVEDDGSSAQLYPEWSGETLTGPVCPLDLAWRVEHLPPDERDAAILRHLEQVASEGAG